MRETLDKSTNTMKRVLNMAVKKIPLLSARTLILYRKKDG